MSYKKLIAVLTLTVTSISLYYLNLTAVYYKVEHEATVHATKDGMVDFAKKQAYLAERWKKVVYTMPVSGKEYTLEELSPNIIALGLDLKPGMHITLRVSVPAIVEELAGMHRHDPAFQRIIAVAKEGYKKNPQKGFVPYFYEAYQQLMPHRPLHTIFFNEVTEGVLLPEDGDKKILAFIEERVLEETERTKAIYEKRLNGYGMGSLVIRLSPIVGVIEVEIQGITSVKGVKRMLESTAQLIFYDVEMDSGKLDEVYNALADERVGDGERPLQAMLQRDRGVFVCAAGDVVEVRKRLARAEVAALVPPTYQLITEAQSSKDTKEKSFYMVYVMKTGRDGRGLLTGNVIKKAYHTFDQGQCQVRMEMNGEGAKAWHEITRSHINQPIGIVMQGLATDDGVFDQVVSAPTVNQPIPGGISTITGDFSLEQAKEFANVLAYGALPAPCEVTGEAITGPTIGEEAQTQAFWVFVMVLLLIIFFMLLYYGTAGLVADVALLVNMLLILGTLAQLNAALTLPGIAGILLTFGMSVDANVLIFERIREELKRGVYQKTAVADGYSRALSSILDGNLTTLLTGVILYVLGQGPIKGFATTLIIGIVSSLFTAVFVTRLIIEVVGPARFHFGFGFTQNLFSGLRINFFRLRRWAYALSFCILCTGGLCIKYKGLVKSVEFTAGQDFVVQLDAPVGLEGVKREVSEELDHASVEVKTYGRNDVIKITTNYRMEDEGVEGDERTRAKLIESLMRATGKRYIEDAAKVMPADTFAILSSTKVGAAIADYVMMMAIYAVLLALLMIFAYILVRFRRWQFGLAAVLALTHDTLMIFAAMGIARVLGVTYEIDQVFVGAVLTVIGYSINDTVVVFDRLRENLAREGYGDFEKVANRSVNETMSRTLITSFTTLLAVLTLFLFGGEALRGFSFTLLVGIVFGTLSSIFALVVARDLEAMVGWVGGKGKTRKAAKAK